MTVLRVVSGPATAADAGTRSGTGPRDVNVTVEQDADGTSVTDAVSWATAGSRGDAVQAGRSGLVAAARDALTLWQHACCCSLHCRCQGLPDRRPGDTVDASERGVARLDDDSESDPDDDECYGAGASGRSRWRGGARVRASAGGPVWRTPRGVSDVQVVDPSLEGASTCARLVGDILACRAALVKFCKGMARAPSQKRGDGGGGGSGGAGDTATAVPSWAAHGCVLGQAWSLHVAGPVGLRVPVLPAYGVAHLEPAFNRLVSAADDPLAVGLWRHLVQTGVTAVAPPRQNAGPSRRTAAARPVLPPHLRRAPPTHVAPAPEAAVDGADVTHADPASAVRLAGDSELEVVTLPAPSVLMGAPKWKFKCAAAPPSILPFWDKAGLRPCVPFVCGGRQCVFVCVCMCVCVCAASDFR